MKLKHFTLTFSGPLEELEKPFLDAYYRKHLSKSKILHIIAILLYCSSSVLDILLFPEIKQSLLAIRFATCGVILLGFGFSFTSLFTKLWQTIFCVYILMTGLSFIMIIIIAPRPLSYSYLIGVIICMISGYIFIRARFITFFIVCWILFICYEVSAVFLLNTPQDILIATSYYLGVVTILGMIIAHTLEYHERKDFYQAYLLEMSNRDLLDKITARQKSEEKLAEALKEKDTYLREIHHRVKNNLQVISSLLDMTCNRSEDTVVQRTLMGARAKIQAMSSVHHQLYQNKNVQKIDMEKQIQELFQNLSMVYGTDCCITTAINICRVYISLEQAMPCALVINELISNALEHAFMNRQKGLLEINMRQTNQKIQLEVQDDGVGLPEDLNMESVDSLGLKLVQILVTRQLKGQVDVKRDKGTTFIIHFDLDDAHYGMET